MPNRGFNSERRDLAIDDAAAEAPGGAGVPNRGFTAERRDLAIDDAAGEGAGTASGSRTRRVVSFRNELPDRHGGRSSAFAGRVEERPTGSIAARE